MKARFPLLLFGVVLLLASAVSSALAYIHFPHMTLPKLCKHSTNIRALTIEKHDKDRGVIVYKVAESLKGETRPGMSFKHAIRNDAEGIKPIVDWMKDGKQAVMFTIETPSRGGIACGYVFIDEFCYSVDYNSRGDFWLLIRAEPNMSVCYHGPAETLRTLAKDSLAGKEIKVPVKDIVSPDPKADRDRRVREVNEVLEKNRK